MIPESATDAANAPQLGQYANATPTGEAPNEDGSPRPGASDPSSQDDDFAQSTRCDKEEEMWITWAKGGLLFCGALPMPHDGYQCSAGPTGLDLAFMGLFAVIAWAVWISEKPSPICNAPKSAPLDP